MTEEETQTYRWTSNKQNEADTNYNGSSKYIFERANDEVVRSIKLGGEGDLTKSEASLMKSQGANIRAVNEDEASSSDEGNSSGSSSASGKASGKAGGKTSGGDQSTAAGGVEPSASTN